MDESKDIVEPAYRRGFIDGFSSRQEIRSKKPTATKRTLRCETADRFIAEMFAVKDEWPSNEIIDAAKERGISRNAMFEAKNARRIQTKRVSEGDEHFWVWYVDHDLPEAAPC